MGHPAPDPATPWGRYPHGGRHVDDRGPLQVLLTSVCVVGGVDRRRPRPTAIGLLRLLGILVSILPTFVPGSLAAGFWR